MRIWEAWVREANKKMSAKPLGGKVKGPRAPKMFSPKKAAKQVPMNIPPGKSLKATNAAVMGKISKTMRVAMSLARYGNLLEVKSPNLKFIRSLVNPGRKMVNAKPINLKTFLRREGKTFRTKESALAGKIAKGAFALLVPGGGLAVAGHEAFKAHRAAKVKNIAHLKKFAVMEERNRYGTIKRMKMRPTV